MILSFRQHKQNTQTDPGTKQVRRATTTLTAPRILATRQLQMPVPFASTLSVSSSDPKIRGVALHQSLLSWLRCLFSALDDTVTNGSSCEHEFHHKCLLDWLNSRARPKECPTCRAPLWDQNKYDNVFQGMQDVNRVDGVSKSSERKRAHNLGV